MGTSISLEINLAHVKTEPWREPLHSELFRIPRDASPLSAAPECAAHTSATKQLVYTCTSSSVYEQLWWRRAMAARLPIFIRKNEPRVSAVIDMKQMSACRYCIVCRSDRVDGIECVELAVIAPRGDVTRLTRSRWVALWYILIWSIWNTYAAY